MFIRLPRRSRGEGEVVKSGKVRRGETQRPAPETSALPRIRVIRRAIIESGGPNSADERPPLLGLTPTTFVSIRVHSWLNFYFRKRFMPSRSMMARQMYSVSIPRIPLILVAPWRKAK